jgi:hypothetical protein
VMVVDCIHSLNRNQVVSRACSGSDD